MSEANSVDADLRRENTEMTIAVFPKESKNKVNFKTLLLGIYIAKDFKIHPLGWKGYDSFYSFNHTFILRLAGVVRITNLLLWSSDIIGR